MRQGAKYWRRDPWVDFPRAHLLPELFWWWEAREGATGTHGGGELELPRLRHQTEVPRARGIETGHCPGAVPEAGSRGPGVLPPSPKDSQWKTGDVGRITVITEGEPLGIRIGRNPASPEGPMPEHFRTDKGPQTRPVGPGIRTFWTTARRSTSTVPPLTTEQARRLRQSGEFAFDDVLQE